MKLFPWAKADEFNLNIFIRLKPGEPDEIPGHVGDFDRRAHVQNKYLAPLTHGPSLKNQLAGLGNGHKVAGDFRMGDGYRAQTLDLLFEKMNHAAFTADHIA